MTLVASIHIVYISGIRYAVIGSCEPHLFYYFLLLKIKCEMDNFMQMQVIESRIFD